LFSIQRLKNEISGLKIFFICAFICIFSGGAFGQTYWAKFQGGQNVDETLGVTGDATGNTYTTGYFSSTAQVNGTSLSVEVNILNFNKEIYGEKIKVELLQYIRDEKKFDSTDALIKAIDEDKKMIEKVLSK